MYIRNRTFSNIIGYGLYLYFLGLSFINTSKALFIDSLIIVIFIAPLISFLLVLLFNLKIISKIMCCCLSRSLV
ncbi:MAG TPA: hypothetical protein VN704_09150 [Verrucomicrobiae bacterium]|nr:hypothetical protein [Verrucomicrobiae bacterium]